MGIAFLAPFAFAAVLGLVVGWFLPAPIRGLALPTTALIGAGAFTVAYYLTVSGTHMMVERVAYFYVGVLAISFAAGIGGFAFTDDRRRAMAISGMLIAIFVLPLPITGIFLSCGLIGACP